MPFAAALSIVATAMGARGPLDIDNATERHAALEARKREHSDALRKRLTELDAQIASAHREHDRLVADDEAAAEKCRAELEAAISKDWRDGSAPLFAAFSAEDSRANAEKIRALFVHTCLRAVAQLNDEVDAMVIVEAFAAQLVPRFPACLRVFGQDAGHMPEKLTETSSSARKNALAGSTAAFCDDLRSIEALVEALAASAPKAEVADVSRRFARRAAHVTLRDRIHAGIVCAELEREEMIAHSVANPVDPKVLAKFRFFGG